MTARLPPQDFLLSVFRYDHESGKLFWRERSDMRPQWNARYAGNEVGDRSNPRRVEVVLNNVHFRAHRIIWKMVYGTEPAEIDHADLNPHNNTLSNLRECSRSQNMGNRRVRAKSGFKGVYFHAHSGLWHASVAGKSQGYHATAEQAHAAYMRAAKLHFGEFARAS